MLASFLIVSLLVATQSFSNATTISGATCTKAGKTKIVSNIKYTCVKSGKKLVWDKGLATKKTSPTPTPTPTPTPNVFTPPTLPSSFKDLETHLSGIIYGSWLKASQKIESSKQNLNSIHYLVGPNTKLDFNNQDTILSNVSKLYSDFVTTKNLYIIQFGIDDINWAQKQYDSIRPINYDPNIAKNNCASEFGCNGGSAGITKNGDGVMMIGQGSTEKSINHDYRVLKGQVYGHEYAHIIQLINSVMSNNDATYGNLPKWLLEGNADWSGNAAAFYEDYSKYLELRNNSLNGQYTYSNIFTSDWIRDFLNPNFVANPGQDTWAYWDKYDRWYVYAFGQMVNEILVSIKGTDSVMNLYKDSGNGMSFADAFLKEFGIPWSEAINYISEAIAAELRQGIKS